MTTTPPPTTPPTVAHDSDVPTPIVQRWELSQSYMMEYASSGEFVQYSDYLTLHRTYWNLLIATGNVAIAAVGSQFVVPESGVKMDCMNKERRSAAMTPMTHNSSTCSCEMCRWADEPMRRQ